MIHVSGRSANVHDRECSYEMSPLTRWTIGGAAADNDVPSIPVFGLNSAGQGLFEVAGIAFDDLTNTRSISAGSLTLHFWNELSPATTLALSQACSEEDNAIRLSSPGSFLIGGLAQIGSEIVRVEEISDDGLTLTVVRGTYGTEPISHDSSVKVWRLDRRSFVLPFIKGIFGTPASGSYSQVLTVPDIRIVAAELYVTNVKGNSQVGVANFGTLVDGGIRTLSGGQVSMQVDGTLAVQSNALPRLSVEAPHAVRDVFATVIEPPTGGPIEARITRDGETYCTLSIPAGETLSDPVIEGLTLPALAGGWNLGLDIISVGTDRPGAGLTVTLRL